MIYTIGHSTRPAELFIALLRAHRIAQIADVRTVPRSRRHPQFAEAALATLLGSAGIRYRHFSELGGLRKPRADSSNTGWRHASFRGYADYMETPSFEGGLERLLAFAEGSATAVMCAEAVWWRCHRRLLADALVVRGVQVVHILSTETPKPHQLSEFARVQGRSLAYPGLL